jgi:hypothetical protein
MSVRTDDVDTDSLFSESEVNYYSDLMLSVEIAQRSMPTASTSASASSRVPQLVPSMQQLVLSQGSGPS